MIDVKEKKSHYNLYLICACKNAFCKHVKYRFSFKNYFIQLKKEFNSKFLDSEFYFLKSFEGIRMKYTVRHLFPYSLQEVLEARENRYKHLDKFPELQNVVLLEERREGDKIYQKRKVSLASSLPTVLQNLLQDPSLLEDSVFYVSSNTHEFTIFPPGNEKVVKITGKSVYRSLSENQCERVYEIEVKSEVFLVSALVEAAIEEIHKHSLEKDKNSILNYLQNKPA